MVKRVLVAMGGTPYARAAIRHAVELARRGNGRVTGIAILDPEAGQAARLGIQVVNERIDANIVELEEAARQAGVDVAVIRERGEPVAALCAEWRYHDLAVMGLRGLFDYEVVAEPKETVSRLIRSGVRPIFAVSEKYAPIRRILIAYSGSSGSAAAMKSLAQLQPWPDAETHLVYLTDGEEEMASCQRLLTDCSAYWADHGVALKAEVQVGGARDHLLSYARKRNMDLIVLGDSAESLLTRRLFGDTTLNVIRNADRSLFISH